MRRWPAFLFLLAIVLLSGTGCRKPAGIGDVAIVLKISTPSLAGNVLARDLRARLGAGKIQADIQAAADGREATVTVSAYDAEKAARLVEWSGGAEIYEIDPDASVQVEPNGELHREDSTLPSGRAEKVWVATPAGLTAFYQAGAIDADHMLLLELADRRTYRVHIVKKKKLLHLSSSNLGWFTLAPDWDAIDIPLSTEGAHALGSIPASKDLIVSCLSRAIAFGSSESLSGGFRAHFGVGLSTYKRALEQASLLSSPHVPKAEVVTRNLPPNYWLAALNVLLPIGASLGWMWMVRRLDRRMPEPIWLVLCTVVLGACGGQIASMVNGYAASFSDWLDPRLVQEGGRPAMRLPALACWTLMAGIQEEGLKMLAVLVLARRRREFDEPIDGIVYSSAAAVGFAAHENFSYLASGRMTFSAFGVREFISAPGHIFLCAVWGYALGRTIHSRASRLRKLASVVPFFLGAAFAHGLYDDLCTAYPTGARLLQVALALLFFDLVRRALRRTKVIADVDAGHLRPRATARAGHPIRSWIGIFGAVLFVYLLTGGAAHSREYLLLASISEVVGIVFFVKLAVDSLPLDAIVSDAGILYSGVLTRFSTISKVTHEGEMVRVEADPPLRLRIGERQARENLVRALLEHLPKKDEEEKDLDAGPISTEADEDEREEPDSTPP